MMSAARTSWKRVLCAAWLGASILLANAAQAEARIGEPVALPPLSSVNGGTLGADALRGKVVVLAYFASYCPFCMLEAPKLQKLYRDNSSRLVVIGVNIEHGDPEQAAKTAAWIARYRLSFPVTLDYPALARVLGKLKGLPVLQVIDRHGVLHQVEVGEMLDEDYADIARFARQD
jgi:thiol-disulfide isomerase/thioredoxin